MKRVTYFAGMCVIALIASCGGPDRYIEMGNPADDTAVVIPITDNAVRELGDDDHLRPDIRAWIDTLGYTDKQLAAIRQLASAEQVKFSINLRNQNDLRKSAIEIATATACLSARFPQQADAQQLIQMIGSHTNDTQTRVSFTRVFNQLVLRLPRFKVQVSDAACDTP